MPLLTRLQNRACAFPFTRLLSGAAPVMSTIQPTGLGDALSALHTYLGHAGFMSYACLLVPLPSTPPLPRQRILGMTPGLRFLEDPSSTSACGRRPAPPEWRALATLRRSCWALVGHRRVVLSAGSTLECIPREREPVAQGPCPFGPSLSTRFGWSVLTTVP